MMKLFFSTLLVIAVATLDGGVAAVELRGNNHNHANRIGATAKAAVGATKAKAATVAGRQQQDVQEQEKRMLQQITETPLNAALTFAPVSAAPPPASCIPVNSTGEPDMLEEYVVVQYNSSAFEGMDDFVTSDTPYVDFTNRTSTFELEITYQYAYDLAIGACPQVGAIREVYAVEVIAYNVTQSTFLLRVGTDSNAATDRFQSLPMNDNCGIVMYNETADVNETLDTDYSYAGYGRRNRQRNLQATVVGGVGPDSLVKEVCDCAPPTALEVLTYFNEAMVLTFNDTRFANWTTSTQQLCIIPDCVPEASTVGSTGKNTLIAAPTATYNATGVCLAADLPAFSRAPSIMPSSEPTSTYEPTGTYEPTNTNAPTLEKPSENPTGTDEPTAEDDSQSPTNTPDPTGTDAPSGDTTTTPTTSPSSDSTTTPAPSSTDDTTTPTASPTVDTTSAPTPSPTDETTSAPTDETTNAPTAETTDPPTPETSAPTPDTTDPPTPEPTPELTPAPIPDTPSPVAPSGNFSGYGRFLVWDGEQMVVEEVPPVDDSSNDGALQQKKIVTREVTVNQAPFAYAQGRHMCQEVDAKLIDNAANRKLCQSYLELPYIRTPSTTTTSTGKDTDVSCPQQMVPKIYWSVSKSQAQSQTQVGITFSNPSYERNHYGDAEALEFIKNHCGEEVGQAYECLAPAAYRADLFRFCALYTHGGLYLDSDLIPLVPLEDLYDPCAVATVGHDWPQGHPQKQMKILAGQAGAPLFLCMIQQIVSNVRSRLYPDNPLALTGPMALQDCYVQYSENVAVTYHDTRDAAYPYSGMRAVNKKGEGESTLLAFESPNDHHDHKNYQLDFEKHEVYCSTCPLHNQENNKNKNNKNKNVGWENVSWNYVD
mmetsp:Transcript_40151/g.44930  ORF Transcript_40151/g.44930 Transcript_40151/m.44930 type:complete len:880 (+) Transcript_40151:122-2761(+)